MKIGNRLGLETLDRIEVPVFQVTDILAGHFTFTKDGTEHVSPFYVRCETLPRDPNVANFQEIRDRRFDAINSQMTDAYSFLESEQCANIEYKTVTPNPF